MKLSREMTKETTVHSASRTADGLVLEPGPVGKALDRVDGPHKVRGEARYSTEYRLEDMAFAALVHSTIAKGSIASIDRSAAESSDGVLAVMTHENAPKMKNPPGFSYTQLERPGVAGSTLPVMQNDEISWDGEPVAVVVAETLEQAEHAASLIRIEYRAEDASVSFDALKPEAELPDQVLGMPPEVESGDAESALRNAEVKVDNVYRTARNNHNAIEPHATIAAWDDDGNLMAYDSTQGLHWLRSTLAQVFDLAPERVRLVAPYVGGGFGGKVQMWSNTVLCAAAAKVVGRPVKLVLSREGVFRIVGWRTITEQRVAIGAGSDGHFVSLVHSGATGVVAHNDFPEQISFPARHLYATENFYIGQRSVYLDAVANGSMRAPGDAPGMFALESAIDELAYELDVDPIELRAANEPDRDPTDGREFSSRNLVEAYRRGAERFGWERRDPLSQRDGKWLIGQGVASAFYPYVQFPASARVRLFADGTAVVQATLHEIGVGAATVQIQHAAQRLGLPVDKVSFEYGDTDLPETPPAGGSGSTASIVAAVAAAVEKLHEELLTLAGDDSPLSGTKHAQTEARDGGLFDKEDAGKGETYSSLLRRAGRDRVEAEASVSTPPQMIEFSMQSYGAQFCEVRVNEESGEVRIARWVGSFDCGRILNPKTAASQFRGAIVMGIGMALTEETLFDERRGRIMNPSLAEYHVPVHLDVPEIDVIWTDVPDPHAPMGVHGVGEIGITGAAAAIANAVFNATGKRIRQLPITLDKLL